MVVVRNGHIMNGMNDKGMHVTHDLASKYVTIVTSQASLKQLYT
jgi:hypothetical protein